MKILQVGKFYAPYKGGIETVVKSLSEGLQGQHRVEVICFADTSLKELQNGVPIHRTKELFRFASQPIHPLYPLKLIQMSAQADLVHIHSPNPFVEALSQFISTPIVVTYHSDVIRQKWALPFYTPFLKRFLARSKRIVVASQQSVDYSPFLGDFKKKVSIIPFGLPRLLDTDSVKEKTKEFKKTFGDYLLFVGRLVDYKGVEVLLEATKESKVPLVLVGTGPNENKLKEQAQRLDSPVHFLGNVESQVDLSALMHASRALCLPSITRAEAFGMVLVEAMSCGKPVISTRLQSGVSSVNQEGISGLMVKPENPRELGLAISRLFSDESLYRKLSEGAAARYIERFTEQKMIASYVRVYEEVLSS